MSRLSAVLMMIVAVSVFASACLADSRLAVIYYVDDSSLAASPTGMSWADATPDLQIALSAANPGDTIRVAGGTYYPCADGDETISFVIPEGVRVYGGYAGWDDLSGDPDFQDPSLYQTVLSGNIGSLGDSTDNSQTVVNASGAFLAIELDGLVIEQGYADGDQLFTESARGAGLYISGSSDVTVSRCVFRANYSRGDGGAVLSSDSMVAFAGCSIEDSISDLRGGGIFVGSGTVSLLNSELTGNEAMTGGGAYITDGGSVEVLGTLIASNTAASGGGAVTEESTSRWVNCVFSGNTSTNAGGAIWNKGGQLTLTNSTLLNNMALGDLGVGGAGLYNSNEGGSGIAVVSNSVFWDNIASGPIDNLTSISSAGAPITVTYSCVLDSTVGGDVYPGVGNIDENPVFSDALGRLADSSPCVDAGDESALPLDIFDLNSNGIFSEALPYDYDGNRRVLGATVEMGAFENRAFSCVIDGETSVECLGSSSVVYLDGSSSSHPDDLPLRYLWTVDCPEGSLDSNDVADPVLTIDTSNGCAVSCLVTLTLQDVGAVDPPFYCNETIVVADTTLPVASDDAAWTDEDNPVEIDVLANDTDSGAPISLALLPTMASDPSHGQVTVNANNTITYTPDDHYGGQDTFTYVVVDDAGNEGTGSVTVTVEPVADTPIVTVSPASGMEDTEIPLTISAFTADSDGSESIEVTFGGLTPGAAFSAGIDNLDGTWSVGSDALAGLAFIPPADMHGDFQVSVMATSTENDNGSTAGTPVPETLSVTVEAINDAPTLSGVGPQQIDEDVDLTFSPADPIAVADVDVLDGDGTVEVTLIGDNGLLTIPDLSGITFTVGDGTADYEVTFSGLLGGVNAALASLVFVPNQDYNGPASVSVTVDDLGNTGDGGSLTCSETIAITVSAVNDAPTVILPSNTQVDEDTDLEISGVGVLDVDSSEGANTLRVSVSVNNGQFALASTAGLTFENGDGAGDATVTFVATPADIGLALQTITYRGNLNYNGVDTLTVHVDDMGNTGAGGALIDIAAIVIGVVPVNDPPVANDDGILVTNEDSLLTFGASALLSNDFDVDRETIEVLSFSQPQHGRLTDNGGSMFSFDYEPDPDYHGTDTFVYVVHDLHGGTDSALVNISVVSVNDAPVNTVPSAQTMDEDAELTIPAISVADVDAGEAGLPVSITLTSNNGLLTLPLTAGLTFSTGDGTDDQQMVFSGLVDDVNRSLDGVVYHPDHDFFGIDTLTITTDDLGNTGSGGALTDIDTVEIEVLAVNDAPICLANNGPAYEMDCDGATATVQLDGSGSSDVENDPLNYAWTTDCPGGVFDDPSSPTPLLTLDTQPGCNLSCSVSLTVDDSDLSSNCMAPIEVEDVTAPSLVCVVGGGGTVNSNCVFETPFKAQVVDECCVDASNVYVQAVLINGVADVAVSGLTFDQTDPGVMMVDGLLSVSNVIGLEAEVEVTIAAEDCCGNVAEACGGTFLVVTSGADSDADGVMNECDNCPDDPNPGQADSNGNGIGDACDTTPAPGPTPGPGPAPQPVDTDNDGVIDLFDDCPDTPADEEVNASGCAESQLDDDVDGIANNLDSCPETPEGATVDDVGCAVNPLDLDEDGVANEDDLCPNTPIGEAVSSFGCSPSQRDSDADGVSNDVDACPGTARGSEVDAQGCSESQLDDDADAVENGLDACPDTPEGSVVDSQGCAPSQLDEDGDGFTNDVDACFESPADSIVDENGCAASQRDSDSDGVTDDADTCPETPAGDAVNETGCSDGQIDDDLDGVFNDVDACPDTADGDDVDADGCSAAQLADPGTGQPVPDGDTDTPTARRGFCGSFGMINLMLTFAGMLAMRPRSGRR